MKQNNDLKPVRIPKNNVFSCPTTAKLPLRAIFHSRDLGEKKKYISKACDLPPPGTEIKNNDDSWPIMMVLRRTPEIGSKFSHNSWSSKEKGAGFPFVGSAVSKNHVLVRKIERGIAK